VGWSEAGLVAARMDEVANRIVNLALAGNGVTQELGRPFLVLRRVEELQEFANRVGILRLRLSRRRCERQEETECDEE